MLSIELKSQFSYKFHDLAQENWYPAYVIEYIFIVPKVNTEEYCHSSLMMPHGSLVSVDITFFDLFTLSCSWFLRFSSIVIVSMCKMKQMNVTLDFVNNTILIHSVTGTAAAGPLAGVHQGAPNAHGCWNVSAWHPWTHPPRLPGLCHDWMCFLCRCWHQLCLRVCVKVRFWMVNNCSR